ncbi:MAG: S41 family peptidase [Saprospiraceae bacterium]|nr:S41 family peptidase [Saprospiraceae bacterium]
MPLFLALATCVGIGVGMKLKKEALLESAPKNVMPTAPAAEEIVGRGRIEEILRYVDAKYVDEVNDVALIDHTVNNLLHELDPHSVYLPIEDLKRLNEDLAGEYEGIGIDAISLNDTLTIVASIANSAAAESGLMTGDKVLTINDSNAIGKNLRWFNQQLRGKKGTTLKLTILRESDESLHNLTLTRDRVTINSVDIATVLDDKTGYVKISRFANTTSREFMQALEKLYEKKSVRDLIIDLRQNPGGYLDKANDILSQIFPDKDKLLVYTKGRTVHRNEYKTTGRSRHDIGKVAILIDEGSASTSEIVAGAIQDWDRGIIVGRRSFGKGMVQEPYRLSDGSELRLTVARFFTPTGRSIQKNYKNISRKQYDAEETRRYELGELTNENAYFQADTTRFFTASGRVVFGGGGIKPDLFVPIQPWLKNDYFIQLRQWIPEYAYRYFLEFRRDIKHKDWQEFQRQFRVSEYAFSEFLKYTERQGIKRDMRQIALVKEPLRRLLKARIARMIYGEEGYYGILSENDPVIMRAFDALKQNDPLGLQQTARK